jgi:hypothetical protein
MIALWALFTALTLLDAGQLLQFAVQLLYLPTNGILVFTAIS